MAFPYFYIFIVPRKTWACCSLNFICFKHVRCNPDVAPRLTSGGYEDKVDVITPINILFIDVHRGWQFLMLYEDEVDVITPINILFRAGGKF